MRGPRSHGPLCGVLLVAAGLLAVSAGCGVAGKQTDGPDPGAGGAQAAPAAAATVPVTSLYVASSAADGSADSGKGSLSEEATGICDEATAAVRTYLETRDRALIPGGTFDTLASMLCPGSPAESSELLVAQGRAATAAGSGLWCAGASTRVHIAPGAVALYAGETPVAPARASGADADDDLRAVVTAACTSTFTWCDRATTVVQEDHVLVLTRSNGSWKVFDDRYAEARLAGWLRAGGAGTQQVRQARLWAAQTERTRRLATTPEAAVRAFTTLLDDRHYAEADLLLAPAFGGTAQGMSIWLKSIRVVTAEQSERGSNAEATLVVTFDVDARPSPWDNGRNQRWVTLARDGADGPWRIVAIDSGP